MSPFPALLEEFLTPERSSRPEAAPEAVAAAKALFLEQLETIERVLAFVGRKNSLQDADDFGSWVKLKLIENDYAIIRKFERRNFPAYISTVIHHLLLDYRIHLWGKWHASAEAKRQGEVAVALEVMLCRDGRSLEEALPALKRIRPDLTREQLDRIAASLPPRARKAREVELDGAMEHLTVPTESVSDGPLARERASLWRRIYDIVSAYFEDVDEEDRVMLRLRFGGGMTVADVSRALRVEQKPLYRQLKGHVAELRKRLEEAGIDWSAAHDLLEHPPSELDFTFLQSENDEARPSDHTGGTEGNGEES
jgi:RNA polymerase sigma factor for flagellar operon FliA